MCGIAGFIDPSLGKDDRDALGNKMLLSTAYRGPDAQQTYTDGPLLLGHNRLSIIDLSAEANQPMIYKHWVLTFNGEIYNYLELKEELMNLGHEFKTTSDSEVLLHAFAQWGEEAVSKLVGMWAFAIWNTQEQRLFCSRDRFGIKPFYFIHSASKIYFSSEIKALKLSPCFASDLNAAYVQRMLQLGWLSYESETIFSAVTALEPGENLWFANGQMSRKKYWSVQSINPKPFDGSYEEATQTFKSLFYRSISLHQRSDVPVGMCLSGGLDSSSIASAICSQFPEQKLHSFTAYYTGENTVDERPWVNSVHEKYANIVPHFINPKEGELDEALATMIHHMDVPVTGSSPLSQYFVMKLIKSEGIKVVMDGQGADEYLTGYMHSYYPLIGGLLKKGKIGAALKLLNRHGAEHGLSTSAQIKVLTNATLSATVNEDRWHQLEYAHKDKQLFGHLPKPRIALGAPNNASRLSQHLMSLISKTTLPTLLQYEDRNSMAFSIESRVPFLDHRLVEFAFSLPDDFKLTHITKRLLRSAMRKDLPEQVFERKDKKGFVTPGEVKWLRGPLKHLIEFDPKQLPLIDHAAAAKLLEQYKAGDNSNAKQVWKLATYNKWLEGV